MIQMIGYLLACFFVGVLLTVGVAMFRPIRQNDEFKSWRYMLAFFAVVAALPYVWVEFLTKKHAADVSKAVKVAIQDAEVDGKLDYYKVTSFNEKENKAKVIAVSNEKSEFGNMERTVMTINIVRDEDGWRADEYAFVNSFKRGRDNCTMPPFW